MDGAYFKLISVKEEGNSFGSLLEKPVRNVMIKTESSGAHFATLSQESYAKSVGNFERAEEGERLNFLREIP